MSLMVTQQQFPGEQALLRVNSGIGDYGMQIYRFYNNNASSSSFINRVEVWNESGWGITLVDLYYHYEGCLKMEEFSKAVSGTIYHHHQHNWCKVQVTDSEKIQDLFRLLLATQRLTEEARSEMENCLRYRISLM